MLIASLDETSALTLPISGAVMVGADLPPDVDIEVLKQELSRFYGDRFWVIDNPVPVAVPETPKPKGRKR